MDRRTGMPATCLLPRVGLQAATGRMSNFRDLSDLALGTSRTNVNVFIKVACLSYLIGVTEPRFCTS